jgi:hypothetical protein
MTFRRSRKPDAGTREAAHRRVEHHAGDRDIGAERDARKHEDVVRLGTGEAARLADAAVPVDEFVRLDRWVDAFDGFGEQMDIAVYVRHLEAVGQRLDRLCKPGPRGGGIVKRDIFQRGDPASFASRRGWPCDR